MVMQHEITFRTLYNGLHVGKIVMRVASCTTGGVDDPHVVTGGTGGLTLLTTGRWFA